MDKEMIEAFGKMTYGLYVLTASHGDAINGMIASWVSQVSYDPPLIMAAVHPHRYSHTLIEEGGGFALHLLSRDQKELLRRFKGPDPRAKFGSLRWSAGRTGCPILADCIGYLECRLRIAYSPGNHTLFIGEVISAGILSPEPPLTTLDIEGAYTGKD